MVRRTSFAHHKLAHRLTKTGGRMQVNITARHIELEDSLKVYANDKLEKLEKYNYSIEEARAIFQKEKFYHITEITLTGKGFAK